MIEDKVYNDFLSALLEGDRKSCISITKKNISENVPVKEIYLNLFQKALYEVGDLWERNKISVSVEHMATAIVEGLFVLVYPMIFSAEHTGKKAVISCLANEFHQVGGKMIADIFELNGWDGYFLGANMPVDGLVEFINEKKPDMLGLSLSIYFNMNALLDAINAVRHNFSDLDIIVGGQAFRWCGKDVIARFKGVTYIESIDRLEKMIRVRR
jgi:methanogenic corrinoid protein MtbC1